MPLSCNLGTLTSWNPLGYFRPVTGLLYLYIINNNTHCNFTVFCASINSCLMLPFCKHDQANQDTYKKSMNDREIEVSVSLIFSGCNGIKYLKSQWIFHYHNKCPLKSLAKNMQSNGQPFKSQVFCAAHQALNCSTRELSLPSWYIMQCWYQFPQMDTVCACPAFVLCTQYNLLLYTSKHTCHSFSKFKQHLLQHLYSVIIQMCMCSTQSEV